MFVREWDMGEEYKKYQGEWGLDGPDRCVPVPMSRLAPPIELVDLEREIEKADLLLNTRLSAKLRVLADQIKALQQEARKVLDEARQDRDLHRVRCTFKRRPGHLYHLYRHEDGSLYFSLLSPEDWNGKPPHSFEGSYRLEADMSWTPAEQINSPDDSSELIKRLLEDSQLK